jgi:hypothetical protein
MIYFISGHRDLTEVEFNTHYVPILNKVLEDDPYARFVVGDWEGCDLMAILHLIKIHANPPIITIYCVEEPQQEILRNLVKSYTRIRYKSCISYDECDALMTEESHFDITWIRPGKENSHTYDNIKRRYENRIS